MADGVTARDLRPWPTPSRRQSWRHAADSIDPMATLPKPWPIVLVLLSASLAKAQLPCSLQWQPGFGVAGVTIAGLLPSGTGFVATMVPWDPDGAGPAPARIVVGGRFDVAGDQNDANIACYDPVQRRFLPLGGGLPMTVQSIVARANGQLAACSGNAVFAWDGSQWQALGPGFNHEPNRIVELPNGDLVVGGQFGSVGGALVFGIARWNGAQWQPMGDPTLPFASGQVNAMGLLPNGDLVVGGMFTQIGGVACNHVARWDGVAWHPLGAGSQWLVSSLATTASGEVVAFGNFTGVTGWSRWHGANWVAITAGAPGNGSYALGTFGSDGAVVLGSGGLWVHDANGWSNVLALPTGVWAMCALPGANGEWLVGGQFQQIQGQPAWNLAWWNGTVWSPAFDGTSGSLNAATVLPNGRVLVSGSLRLPGVPMGSLAEFDGSTWSAFGPPSTGATALVARRSGQVLVAGTIPIPSGGTAALAAIHNGTVTPIPLPVGQFLQRMALAADDSVWVATSDVNDVVRLFTWNGASLVALPAAVTGFVFDMVATAGGQVVLAGSFTPATGFEGLLRWDGLQLRTIFGAPSEVLTAVAVAANGDLFVGTAPQQPPSPAPPQVLRYDGTGWQSMAPTWTDRIAAIVPLPDGDVLATSEASFSGPNAWRTRLHRWHAGQWTQIAEADRRANLLWSPDGSLVAYGSFLRIAGGVRLAFARLLTTCPSAAQDLGGGCTGSAGTLTTHIDERAWLGGTFRTTTRGVPANALAIGVFGANQVTLPLGSLLPIGGAGCTLRVAPDVLLSASVANGVASSQWALPNAPALLGASFVQQTLVLETAAGGASALRAGPGTLLTVGAW